MLKTAISTLALCAALMGGAVSANAQQAPRLLKEPTYGEVRLVLGETLIAAPGRAKCSEQGRLAGPELCFDEAISFMRAGGLTELRVFGVVSPPPPGPFRAPYGQGFQIFRIESDSGAFAATALTMPDSRLSVPRSCFSLPGEPVTYEIAPFQSGFVARERQVVACGGGLQNMAGPFKPVGPSMPAAPPPPGVEANTGQEGWTYTGERLVLGDARALAAPKSECVAEKVLRDGICFDEAIAALEANPSLKELDVVGARRPVAPGEQLAASETEQYVLKRRRDGFKADKRFMDRSMMKTIPPGCGGGGAIAWRVMMDDGRTVFRESKQVGCGAPAAPPPKAIYETYGRVEPLAEPGPCAETGRLLGGGVCMSNVISYMRSAGIGSMQVAVASQAVPVGTRLTSNQVDAAEVSAQPDGSYKADRKNWTSETGISTLGLSGCSKVNDPSASGVIVRNVNGWKMAEHFSIQACDYR